MGIFQSIDKPSPTPMGTTRKAIYVTIALTELNAETGWYDLCEGTHLMPRNTNADIVKERAKSLKLAVGDAILWHSGLATIQTPGGGGKFETFMYST
jgi:ectoine hydroxylase-related dioxygenase (phytanoyl-CoA dioxygenase family)